jgi:tetratricopeptide (TPR) repeat protein
MQVPTPQSLALNDGVLPEPHPGNNVLVLWVRGDRADGFQHWERVASVAGAAVEQLQGVCAVPATAVRVRQRLQGLFGKFLGRFRQAPGQWLLPGGESAEQVGDRRSDLCLAWAAGADAALDEARVRARWPDCRRAEPLGNNLFLVGGVDMNPQAGPPNAPAAPTAEPDPVTIQREPREAALMLLTAARQSGDRRKEVAALTDLGILYTRAHDGRQAVAHLDPAWALARQLGDAGLENDVVGNLGLALMLDRQPQRGLAVLMDGLQRVRTAQDRFTEKSILENLGESWGFLGDRQKSLAYYEEARVIAEQLGDRSHQADLLWFQAIQYALQEQRAQAIARADAAVALLRALKNPQGDVLAKHLEQYRAGDGPALGAGSQPGARPTAAGAGQVVVGGWQPQPAAAPPVRGAGVLQMAFSAAKAMVKYLGSGMKTVPAAVHQQRVRTCAACEHHTGLRCKLCGCFTNTKAWLPYEHCPIGKWSAQ